MRACVRVCVCACVCVRVRARVCVRASILLPGLLGENDTFDCFAVGCSAGQFCECLEANLSLCSCVSEYNQSTTAVPSS